MYIYMYIYIHIWVYICTHKHSYKYFKIHEFTPIPPVAIHSQRVLSCLPAFYICIFFIHRENSSFQQRPHIYSFVHLNTLVHLKEFQNCFACDIIINNVRRRVWDLFAVSLPIYPKTEHVYKLFRLVGPSQPSLPVSLLSLSVAVVFIQNQISFMCFSLLSVAALSLYSYCFNFIFEYVEYYISEVKQYKRHDQKCITASCVPSTQFP